MGKTKMLLSHIATNDDSLRQIEKPVEIAPIFAVSTENNRSARIDDSELDSAFSDSPEPMDLDIEYEYEEEGLLEEESLSCFVENENIKPASGIQFDEMENLILVMQQSESSQEAELNAVNTIQELNQTELFQLMVSQIEGGKERVTEMLSKYNPDALETKPMIAESGNNDFEKFEINNFL
jgi:predicted DNA binding CopG/RHH family protein